MQHKQSAFYNNFRLRQKLLKLGIINVTPSSTPRHHYQVNGEAESCSSARWVRFARQSSKHLQTVTRQQVSRGSPGQRARTSPNALVHTHICREPTMAATLVERVDHVEDPLRTF